MVLRVGSRMPRDLSSGQQTPPMASPSQCDFSGMTRVKLETFVPIAMGLLPDDGLRYEVFLNSRIRIHRPEAPSTMVMHLMIYVVQALERADSDLIQLAARNFGTIYREALRQWASDPEAQEPFRYLIDTEIFTL